MTNVPDLPDRPEVDEPRVGTDEWVAQVEGRREGYRGLTAPLQRAWERLPPIARLAVFVVPAALFPLVSNTGDLFRYGLITLIYALLALGLNIVVGFAGLLDLGYIAFFGFGAYTYGILASPQFDHHWHAELVIPIVLVASAVLGLILGLPSRRLFGDYLAIVTLFFGQAFVVFVNNANQINFPLFGHVDLTGGTNGVTNIDALNFFGYEVTTTKGYYYVSLIAFAVIISVLHLVNESRTGRAWRALREDPLAAEVMSIPVKRLKLLAFAFGAATAGFTGTIYASVQTGAFPGDYDIGLLITIYAIVILGGAGSLAGVVIGALIVNGVPELLRNPENAEWIFYIAILAALLLKLRPWRRLAAVLAGVVALGFAANAFAELVWERGTAGTAAGTGLIADAVEHWMLFPGNATQIANWGFAALVASIMIVLQLKGMLRTVALVPVVYLAAFVWENRLLQEVAGATRLLLLGALLVVLMNARPQGLMGTSRVEIV
jgi:ABC-type branched-subunit amino acid transport system permease subunit